MRAFASWYHRAAGGVGPPASKRYPRERPENDREGIVSTHDQHVPGAGRVAPDAFDADPHVSQHLHSVVRSGMGQGSHTSEVDAGVCRCVARALLGEQIPAALLERSLRSLLAVPDGADRFARMSEAASDVMSSGAPHEGGDELASRSLAVHRVAFDVLASEHAQTGTTFEQVTDWLARITAASTWEDLSGHCAEAIRELSGFSGAAVYETGVEHARLARSAMSNIAEAAGVEAPIEVRIDRGVFADAMASERPVFIAGIDPRPDLPPALAAARTIVAIPLRDIVGRPVGLVLAWDVVAHDWDPHMVDSLRRLADVTSGVMVAMRISRIRDASIDVLPELAGVAHGSPVDAADQLEELCSIIVRATGSDAAVIRLRDPAGMFLETPAAATRDQDAVGDVIGTRSAITSTAVAEQGSGGESEVIGIDPEDPGRALAGWSPEGRRLVTILGGRTLAAFPIGSRHERPAVLYVVRRTARPFDDTDRSCIRIVTAHAQHVIDRHVANLQVRRAIGAARNAIRLLGEALVAGVHARRTSRFVPRLYTEMFGAVWCRSWQVDGPADTPELVASVGSASNVDPGPMVAAAVSRPLELHLDTQQRPHVAAIGMDAFDGSLLVVEFELPRERSLGQEEQHLAVDVAVRVAEALRSAGQAAAHEQQIRRMQQLQDVIAVAHDQLSEAHIVSTVMDHVPAQYGADAAVVFVSEGGGMLRARAVRGVPDSVVAAIEASRSWVADVARDEESVERLFASRAIGSDARLAAFHDVAREAEIDSWGILVVPLRGREQTIGLLVLLFQGDLPERIQSERDTLNAFGRQVGRALVHAREFERERIARVRTQRMLEDERENSRQVRALHEVSRTFAASLSLDETMRAVVEAMAHRLDVDAVWIRTPNDRGDLLEVRAFYASHPELSEALERMVSAPAARTDPVMARVMTTREPVLIRGGEASPDLAGSTALGRLSAFLQHGSTIAVLPVAIPNEVLGTLTMLSIDPEHELTWGKVDIAGGVTSQAALALDNARLYQQQKHFAEVIQESLLPGRLPDIPGVELGVLYRSATTGGAEAPLIGGDFYDFLELDDGRLALAVGDVTGKGVGAAADTAMTKYIFRALAREHPSPSSFLRYANEVVCEEITPGKFVTLFYAVIDPRRGTILCGNAGHPEPKIMHAAAGDGTPIEIESVNMEGLALGILPEQDYEERTFRFDPGATLIAYTDGVVEARRDGRLYGQYRLESCVRSSSGASAPHVAFSLYQDCASFAEDGLGDDVAIVVVQRVAEQ